ncbi:Fc.00g066820.m01.CDS01 [Cosmosporella sp. VM-42]
MVSTRSLFQTVLVLVSAMTATAAPAAPRMTNGVPYMPRIPSAAKHHEILRARATTEVDLGVLVQATCLQKSETIVFHDENVAQLNICGGIAGAIDKCEGAPKETVGEAGSAKFTVTALDDDATITISKERWVQCVRAARAECPTGSFSAICSGGGSTGDVAFTLENPQTLEL